MMQLTDFIYILVSVLCFCGYIWANMRFCKRYLKISKGRELIFTALFFSGWVLGTMNEQYTVSYMVLAMLHHIFFVGLVVLLFHGDVGKKISVAAILLTVTTLAGNFFTSFFSCVALIWQHMVNHVLEPIIAGRAYSVINNIVLIIEIAIICWLTKSLCSVFYDKTRRWYVTLAVLLFAFTAMIDVANWGSSNGIMVRSGGNMGLFYDQLFSHAEILALTALSMFAAGFYVFGMNRIDLEQKKAAQYHSQVLTYKMLEQQYSRSERLRHDMKNHIIALSGLLEDKEWEKMNDYLNKMRDSANLGTGEELTGSRVVDALLYQKREKAEQQGILWQCDVQIPKLCGMEEFDLCILFGNILDNAVNACEAMESSMAKQGLQRFIDIQGKTVKKCFLLEVKNSIRIKDKNQAGTAYQKKQHWGTGLLNVNDVVQKYNGAINMEVEKNIFSISILIPLADAVHDSRQAI